MYRTVVIGNFVQFNIFLVLIICMLLSSPYHYCCYDCNVNVVSIKMSIIINGPQITTT